MSKPLLQELAAEKRLSWKTWLVSFCF